MKKRIFVVLMIGVICWALESCNNITTTTEVIKKDEKTIALENFKERQTSVTDEILIEGEPFSLICKYDTGNYTLNDWRVTSNKNINMTVNTSKLPDGYNVHIEHIHADISLKSTEPQIDGITQDSMDDSDHRIPTKGFPISDTIAYNNNFAIEGYTEQFYSLWGYAFNGYGTISSTYQRLTEGNLRKVGTYAEKLSVVYDIVISTPECEEGYVKSVYSEVLIPLVSKIETAEKNIFTGEVVN